MRKYLPFLLFFFYASLGFAQSFRAESQSLKAGIGLTGYSQESVSSPSLFLEFTKDFFPRTTIGISAIGALPVDVETDTHTSKLNSFRFNMNFYYNVLDSRKQWFIAGLGLSAGHFRSKPEANSPPSAVEDATFKAGGSAIVEYNFIFSNSWLLGARGSLSRYDSNRSSWFLGVTTGFRF